MQPQALLGPCCRRFLVSHSGKCAGGMGRLAPRLRLCRRADFVFMSFASSVINACICIGMIV